MIQARHASALRDELQRGNAVVATFCVPWSNECVRFRRHLLRLATDAAEDANGTPYTFMYIDCEQAEPVPECKAIYEHPTVVAFAPLDIVDGEGGEDKEEDDTQRRAEPLHGVTYDGLMASAQLREWLQQFAATDAPTSGRAVNGAVMHEFSLAEMLKAHEDRLVVRLTEAMLQEKKDEI